MKIIPKPIFTAKEVYLECISSVSDEDLKEHYTNCQDIIERAESVFELKFPLNEIYQIPQIDFISENIGKVAMVKVYTYRMVHVDQPGRKFYDQIKSLAPRGKCPFCAIREVDTLDHYLPKKKFPVYAVIPINLAPSCTPCNKDKKVSFPSCETDQTFHPYYDDVEQESWIKAKVIRYSPICFDYFVECPRHWDDIKQARAQNHFISFNLNELYSSHANDELLGAALQLKNLFSQDPNLLVNHIREAYNSRLALGINSWQAVMYCSLLNNQSFLQGGVLATI